MARRKAKPRPKPVASKPVTARKGFFSRLVRRRAVKWGVPIVAAAGLALSSAIHLTVHSKIRPALEPVSIEVQQKHFLKLGQERTRLLNPFVQSHLNDFTDSLDRRSGELFSQLSRFGKEQGGYVEYNPKTNFFKFRLVDDRDALRLEDALSKAKAGDFSGENLILHEIRQWNWSDRMTFQNGQSVPITPELLMDRFTQYKRLCEQRNALRKAGRIESAKRLDSEIQSRGLLFEIMQSRFVSSGYWCGEVVTNLFPENKLFSTDSDERFFCHFHTHPFQTIQGKRIPLGHQSDRDLSNTVDYGPSTVLEFGDSFNAVHLLADGKVLWAKKYPLTTNPATKP